MPVHNEESAIRSVVTEWTTELDRLGLDYELSVYDDGSTDTTAAILDALRVSTPRLAVYRHANRGHGATVLRGYRHARAEWVFQTDSDGEMAPTAFRLLWERRAEADLVMGCRADRLALPARRFVTRVTRLVVGTLFGKWFQDVNTPFRLMRRSSFARLFTAVPNDCFAPNVALAGLAARASLRVCEVRVPYLGRTAGRTSLRGVKLWRACVRSFWQTLALAIRTRRRSFS
jgi:glycosyltransferase involved in cell wall biosynthesis